MKALIYLIKRTAANNLKKAVRKPMTLLALIFGAAYGIFLEHLRLQFGSILFKDLSFL